MGTRHIIRVFEEFIMEEEEKIHNSGKRTSSPPPSPKIRD